jgi:biotin transport system substrate-specific component
MEIALLKKEIVMNKTACRAIGIAAFVIMTALGAFVRVPLPFSPVPLTLQTFFVLLSGAFLGGGLGIAAQAVYLGLGLSGISVFTASGSGLLYLAGPTTGYLFGFILAAFISGSFARNCKNTFALFVLFCLADLAILACGALWLKFLFGIGMDKAMFIGLVPFLAGDVLKAALAAVVYARLRSRAGEIFSARH